MKLGAFFGRPAPASTPPDTPDRVSVGVSSRRSSIVSIDMDGSEGDATPAKEKSKQPGWILPFFLLENTDLAPNNRFIASKNHHSDMSWLDRQNAEVRAKGLFGKRRARIRRVVPVRDMVAKLEGSEDEPIDLTANYSGAATSQSLKSVPYKVLHFREDVRPPYQGTYTRPVSPRSARKLSRRPVHRGLPDTDYDYDSEAEWQEPEPDDEDLECDDDLSEDEEGAEEMGDFLDDEADAGKRIVSTSDVEPLSTGLCWEGETSLTVAGFDLGHYRMQLMHDDQRLPIDPYSTSHWKIEKQEVSLEATTAMQPPRLPLQNVSVNSLTTMRAFVTGPKIHPVQKEKEVAVAAAAARGRPANPNKPIKTIPAEYLADFKKEVNGSDANKALLLEMLKKKFPKCSKDAIKGTLDTVAVRMGLKEADKRWVLKT
jgi:chromatin assembly factor 1 subunit A